MADDAGLINEVLAETSFLYGGNAAFVEDLYAKWSADPNSVEPSWRAFFASLHDSAGDVSRAAAQPAWTKAGAPAPRPDWLSALDGMWPAVEAKVGAKIAERAAAAPGGASTDAVRAATLDSLRAIMMIRAYRMRGHLKANLDPLGIATTPGDASELDPATYGFSEADFDRPIFLDFVLGLETATIREILEILRRTYCGNVGVQYMHISDPKEKGWLQARIEGRDKEIVFTKEGKVAILKKLIETEGFEKFLHRRFPGTKRFGLDGGESLVPALEQIIKRGGALGVKDIIIGMPHRGRLNVLAAVMGKPYQVIFHEFQGGSSLPSDVEGSGDVKYHLGASSDREFDGNSVHLSLTANPSHLEIVNPVVIGKARAKQAFTLRQNPSAGRSHVLPLLMHGDAAFAGQGVVAECFALSGLRGYGVGGSVHFIVNNQIGFTTSPKNSRSSPYPSDVALMVEAPIFHANGDDPEAVVFAAKVATEYRQQFGKDVVVDMFCYRRFGHNEGDDPTMTQPLMYAKIKEHPSVRDLYATRLVREGDATQAEIDGWIADFDAFLDAEFDSGKILPRRQGRLARRQVVGTEAARLRGKRRHRRRPAEALGPRPEDHHHPRADQRPQDGRTGDRRPPRGHREGRGDRLVDRRAPGLRHPAGAGLSGAPVRPGQRARHLHPAPLRDRRPEDRGGLFPAPQPGAQPGALRGAGLGAVGGGGAGLRVRLLADRPQYARHVGGPVRRLRQRRPGGDRPVHLVGRAQVAADERPRHAVAARLRGPGARALLGAPGALPAALRRRQHAGGQRLDAGQLLPRPAPPDDPRVPEAADRHDPQVAAAPQGGRSRSSATWPRAPASTG